MGALPVVVLYVMGAGKKGELDTTNTTPMKLLMRYSYMMTCAFGLAMTLFQDRFAEAYSTNDPLSAEDKHVMWWWGSMTLNNGLALIAITQCGYKACRKAQQYNMM